MMCQGTLEASLRGVQMVVSDEVDKSNVSERRWKINWVCGIGLVLAALGAGAWLAWSIDLLQTQPLTETKSIDELVHQNLDETKVRAGTRCFDSVEERNAAWLRILVDIDRQTWAEREGVVERHGASAPGGTWGATDGIPELRAAQNDDIPRGIFTDPDLCFVVSDGKVADTSAG